jgi:cytochrome P450
MLLTSLKKVPGPKGLEHAHIMNQAVTYINDAVMTLNQRYGEIFVFGFGPIRFHWLVGPQALKFVLQDCPEAFSMKKAYGFLEIIGGSTALISSDEPQHLKRRRLVQPAFHGQRLQHWMMAMESAVADFYQALPKDQVFDYYAACQKHILEFIVEGLLGKTTLMQYPTLLSDIQTMMQFANLAFLAQQFKLPIPFTPWYRFVKARERADKAIYTEIAKRKKHPVQDESMLRMLLEIRDDTGETLSDKEIRDQCISLVSAGFDTTSAALSWAVYLVLTHPETRAGLEKELRVSGFGFQVSVKTLTPETRNPTPLLEAVIQETLRLYPAAPAGLRLTTQDLEYKGYLLPKNSLVAYSIYATHRQESLFPDALTFKPERWLGDKKPDTFSYIPFGYGARYCIGARLATALIKTHLTYLFTHFNPEAAWSTPIQEAGNTVHPKGGLEIRLKVEG